MKKIKSILLIIYVVFNSGCTNISENKCDQCLGTGKRNCSTCNGSGETNCNWCYGRGIKSCSECSGDGTSSVFLPQELKVGYQYVTYLGKTEYAYVWASHYANFPCPKCNKSGNVECSNVSCNNGKVSCIYCNGSGQQNCMACNGTGND